MDLKKYFETRSLTIIIFQVILICLAILIFQNNKNTDRIHENETQSVIMADVLRTSSNNLTRFARAYVSTGDSNWEKKYWEVLNIRNGIKPWTNGRIISLQDSLKKLGFTETEFDKLKIAEQNSNALVYTEKRTLNLVKGFYDDGKGNFTIKGKPDQLLAQQLLFNEKYHSDKALIMNLIDEFFVLFQQRIDTNLKQNSTYNFVYIIALNLLILIIIIISLVSYYSIRSKINIHDKELNVKSNLIETLVQTIPDLIWLKDTNGVYLQCNPEFERFFGAKEATILGKTDYDFVDKELADVFRANDLKALENIKPTINEELLTFASDGYQGWFETTKTPMQNNEGEKIGVLGIARDITERKEAEETLKSEKEFSEKIIQTSIAIIVGLDKNHLIRIFNEGAEKITGYKKEEVLGKDWFKLFFSAKILDEMNLVWEDAWGISFHSNENEILTKTGEERVISWQSTGFYDDKNIDKHLLISIGEDITDHKKEGEEILKMSLAVQQSNSSIVITNLDGDIEFVNQQFIDITGYSFEEVKGKNPSILSAGETPIETYENLWDSILTGKIWKGEVLNKKKNGEVFIEASSIYPLLNDKGEIINFVAVKEDITERKTAENLIFEKEQRLTSIYDTVGDVIFHLTVEEDGNYKFSSVNASFSTVTGIPKEAVIGKSVHKVIPEPSLSLVLEKYKEAIETKSMVKWEETTMYPTGELVGAVSVAPVFDKQGRCTNLVGSVHEITEIRTKQKELEKHQLHLEEIVAERTKDLRLSEKALLNLVEDLNFNHSKLEISNKKLASINTEMEAFTYSVSHDLKAPLRGIDGYSKLLLDIYEKDLNEEAKDFLNKIRLGTNQMNTLIEDLLSYSRLERQEFQLKEIALKPLINELLMLLSSEISTNNVQINTTFQEDFTIKADSSGLKLVLRNLLDNAIKYSKNQKNPQIEIGSVEKSTHWLIFVRDNGVGFDMKYHDRIFKIFQRLHLPEEFSGTGIGLAMVEKAMYRMNGRIWAESELNAGSCFYIEIKK